MIFDVNEIRKQFPYFKNKNAGIYLDNAATTHKPKCVIDSIVDFYENFNSNVHRSIYETANIATEALENVRSLVSRFINAKTSREIIFTKGATDGVNLIAQSYAKNILRPGDEVLVSLLEHNSNYLPWIEICKELGAIVKIIPLNDENSINLDALSELISSKTKIIALTLVSNIHGGIMPVKQVVEIAKAYKVKVVVDAAQALMNIPIDVQDLGCDFMVASAHKAYGPTGVGFLYVKEDNFDTMTPYQFGGGMLEGIINGGHMYSAIPHKFEAGTPNISGIIGFGSAIDFIIRIKFEKIIAHEHLLLKKISDILSTRAGIVEIKSPNSRCSIVSMIIESKNLVDIAFKLDARNIFIRFGKLCCHNYFGKGGLAGVLRVSTAIYNTESEIDSLFFELDKILKLS